MGSGPYILNFKQICGTPNITYTRTYLALSEQAATKGGDTGIASRFHTNICAEQMVDGDVVLYILQVVMET